MLLVSSLVYLDYMEKWVEMPSFVDVEIVVMA